MKTAVAAPGPRRLDARVVDREVGAERQGPGLPAGFAVVGGEEEAGPDRGERLRPGGERPGCDVLHEHGALFGAVARPQLVSGGLLVAHEEENAPGAPHHRPLRVHGDRTLGLEFLHEGRPLGRAVARPQARLACRFLSAQDIEAFVDRRQPEIHRAARGLENLDHRRSGAVPSLAQRPTVPRPAERTAK